MPTDGDAIERGLEFLAGRQLPSGRFPILQGPDMAEAAPDSSLFATALVAHALGHCAADSARAMVSRALGCLRTHMEPGGVWRHWPSDHFLYQVVPADLDDTACASSLLRSHGAAFPDNTRLLLANRDRNGLFYSWLVARWSPPPPSLAFWRVALRRWRRPRAGRSFWTDFASAPDDVDGIVNANVLYYLGDGGHAPPVVAYLLGILRRGEEDRCDKWYRSPFTFYYALSRCGRAGIAGVASARDEICERIEAAATEAGRIGTGPLDTALALCALADWGADGEVRERARTYLTAVQSSAGSWAAEPFYFGGPRGDPTTHCWGSEELTTGLCLEALAR